MRKSFLLLLCLAGCVSAPPTPAPPPVILAMAEGPAPTQIDVARLRSMSLSELRRLLAEAQQTLNDQLDVIFTIPSNEYEVTAAIRRNVAIQTQIIVEINDAIRSRETGR